MTTTFTLGRLTLTFFMMMTYPSMHSGHVFTDYVIAVEWSGSDVFSNVTCSLHDLSINSTFTLDSGQPVTVVATPLIDHHVTRCLHHHMATPQSPTHRHKRGLMVDISKGIIPGTKWCGRHTLAKNYSELGHYNNTDACCREHDYCPVYAEAESWAYSVYNINPYTICGCKCDHHFRQCLMGVNTPFSDVVGGLFFNVGEPPCIDLHPWRRQNNQPLGRLLRSARYDNENSLFGQIKGVMTGHVHFVDAIANIFG